MATTLIELSTEIERLEVALTEIDDEEQQAALITEYLQTKHDLKIKLDNYSALIVELEARAEVRKQEAKRLSDRASFDANLAKRLKAQLLWYLQEHDIKKVETQRYCIFRSRNGGKAPLVINEDYSVIKAPKRFQKVSVDFDKEQIRLALENGEELDFAYLTERQEGIRIK
jgi:hypothetical protein